MTAISRRALLASVPAVPLLGAVRQDPDKPARTPRTRFAANIEMWWTDRPVLDRIRAHAAKLKIPLMVLVIPSPWNLCGPRHGGVVDREKYSEYVPRSMSGQAEDAARLLGLPCVNLFDTYASNDPESHYLRAPDNHWNDKGQALAAKVVSEALVDQQLLKRN